MLPLLATIRSRMPSLLRSASVTAPGVIRPVEHRPGRWCLPPAVIDDQLVEALIGVDKCRWAVAGQGGHGQRDWLVQVADGLKRAVAVADQDPHVSQRVADQQVGLAVAVKSATVRPLGSKPASSSVGRRKPPWPSLR